MRSLCTKHDIRFSRSSKYIGFLTEFFILKKIKKDAAPFSVTCGRTHFEYKHPKKMLKTSNELT